MFLTLAAIAIALTAVHADAQRLGAALPAPSADQQIVATIRSGTLTITGRDFGEVPAARAVLFDYGLRTTTITADSALVDIWQPGRIEMAIPWEVLTGELRIVVDGIASNPIELLVFDYDEFPIPAGSPKRPLALATAPDGHVWLNQEFNTVLKSLLAAEQPPYAIYDIPQASGPGIFATKLFGDRSTPSSVLGEDIAVDEQGRVWFSQGGDLYYSGAYPNTSRLVRYDPASGQFDCFNLPNDNAGIIGVAVDAARGLVWYSEGSIVAGSAVGAITLDSTLSNCYFDPHNNGPRDPLCPGGPADDCHWRFPLPNSLSSPAHIALDDAGDVWFTQFWSNSVARLDPETGEIIEVPFPPSIVQKGNGIYAGSGPWELSFDRDGYLWVTEFFDATLTKIDPALLATQDCLHLDKAGLNPCVEEVYVASDGTDLKEMHTVFAGNDGRVWFTLTDPLAETGGSVGFVTAGGQVVLLEGETLQMTAGITQDAATGDVWFAEYIRQAVGRLRLAEAPDDDTGGPACQSGGPASCVSVDSDGDGCSDAEEFGSDPQYGGRRDPASFWDFYDTPGLSGTRDGSISLAEDVLALAGRLGASDDGGRAQTTRYSDPLSPLPKDPTAYHPAFDRSWPAPGADIWDLGPPDGYINLFDVLGMLYQYGHRCQGPIG